MSLLMFRINLNLIQKFVRKLERENAPISIQKILIKVYADHLRLRLTDKIIEELISDQYLKKDISEDDASLPAKKR